MVLIKNFLAATAIFASATVAIDVPSTDSEAAAFWGQLDTVASTELLAPIAPATALVAEIIEERGDDDYGRRPGPRPPKVANPYQGRECPRKLDLEIPKRSNCERNECFNSFLSTQKEGRHCPSEAFAFCCLWLSAGGYGKKWAVSNDWIFRRAPYAKACNGYGDRPKDVIRKIDDVCGCTIKQKVTTEVDNEYFKLRERKPDHPTCRRPAPHY
ncbi:hypothetical protein F5X68DRAFT_263022 [Plectosphaerella plurivora]|uniref:Uncharacterized protein n=1 Tax=Plectosphaerella plurivora TaxID=936078 RepID=A0A9P8V6C3_9PEZI|nr:hypothetical protein F5X68DRAFT_263022 [Plectosphaerella plurivora]